MLYLLLSLRYKYFEERDVYKKFLEIEVVPFFKAEENIKDLKKIYLELAEYLEECSDFKESNRYYKLGDKLIRRIRRRNSMKKLIAGTFVVMAIAAVVLDIQYAWKPDTLGQEAKTVQQINS